MSRCSVKIMSFSRLPSLPAIFSFSCKSFDNSSHFLSLPLLRTLLAISVSAVRILISASISAIFCEAVALFKILSSFVSISAAGAVSNASKSSVSTKLYLKDLSRLCCFSSSINCFKRFVLRSNDLYIASGDEASLLCRIVNAKPTVFLRSLLSRSALLNSSLT